MEKDQPINISGLYFWALSAVDNLSFGDLCPSHLRVGQRRLITYKKHHLASIFIDFMPKIYIVLGHKKFNAILSKPNEINPINK